MAYNNNGARKTYNRANNNQQNNRPKKITIDFPVVLPFGTTDRNGNFTEIDQNTVIANLEELNNNQVFSILTTPVNVSRALIMNDNTKKGNVVVGFINSFDLENMSVAVTIYATSVENMNKLMENTPLGLDLRINGYNHEFRSFTGFTLIPVEEVTE